MKVIQLDRLNENYFEILKDYNLKLQDCKIYTSNDSLYIGYQFENKETCIEALEYTIQVLSEF